MHVVILCDFATPGGGSQRVAIESARALAEAGVRVTYLHAVAGRDPRLDHPLIACETLDLPDVWDRPFLSAAVTGVWNRAAASKVARQLAPLSAKPDTVLHLHQWTRAFSPSVLAAALDTRQPLAVTAHDYFLACPNGLYYRFDKAAPCALTPLSGPCIAAACDPRSPAHKAVRVARTALTARAIRGRGFDVVHVSDRGRDTLAPLLPPGLRHHRIDNPISIAPRGRAAIDETAAITFIGRLTREKGAVLAAAAAARADRPIRFIGDGPAEAEIRAANPAAELLGWRSAEDIGALMSHAVRAVVAPSLWLETGPLTVLEAAAAGVAAIASDRCGAAERVRSGVTGLVAPPNVDALAAAIVALDNIEIARRWGAAACDTYWSAPPTPANHAASLIDLYAAMLGRGAT